jgi:hypothetical protein
LSQIRAIGSGAVFDEKMKGFAVENAGVFGEEAKENADEKAFEVVAGVAAGFEGVVKVAENLSGFDVDRVFFLERVLLVAGNEGEGVNVAMKISERKFNGRAPPFVEERQVALFLRLKVVQRDAREIGDDDVARELGGWICAGEVLDLIKRLRFCFTEVFAKTFVFDQQHAAPKHINESISAGDAFNWLFKGGDETTFQPEDL